MISISRAGWDARPPDCADPLNRSKVTLFIVHYSGETRDQTPRSIQNYCMDTKEHCDIDYNRIVRGEYDYMGRGWNIGGHTKDHNSISYGVCMIGVDGDATDADKRTIREIYDEVCAALGRQLTMTTHRNVLGESYTSCPGNELDAWVDAGMPITGTEGEDDMTPQQDHDFNYMIWRVLAMFGMHPTMPGGPEEGVPVPIIETIQKLDAKIDALSAPTASVDVTALAAALRPELDAAAERAVRKVLGSLDDQ